MAEHKFNIGDTIYDPDNGTFTFHINKIEDGKYIESDDAWVLISEADECYEKKDEVATIHPIEDVVSTETLRKQEIEEAANEYVEDEPDGAQKVISKVGFIFGAEWADENPRIHHQLPVGNVWHDSNIEQPQLGSDIVVLQGKNCEVLNSTISVEPDRLWAYINDLLDLTKREEAMTDALRTEYEKGRADVLRGIDPDKMVADFCSQPLSKTRSLASIYRQGIIDIVKRINNNEKTSITSTRSINDCGMR